MLCPLLLSSVPLALGFEPGTFKPRVVESSTRPLFVETLAGELSQVSKSRASDF